MSESPQLSPAERKALAIAALDEVKAACSKIGTQVSTDTTKSIDPSAESKMHGETVYNAHEPTVQAAELKAQHPDEYKGFLRAAARALVPDDPKTRHAIYRLLGCGPKETEE